MGVYRDLIDGLVLVQSESELEQRVDESTRAIVIDRSIAGELSAPFLARQLASGVVLYGLNIPSEKLVAIADWDEAYEMKFGRTAGTAKSREVMTHRLMQATTRSLKSIRMGSVGASGGSISSPGCCRYGSGSRPAWHVTKAGRGPTAESTCQRWENSRRCRQASSRRTSAVGTPTDVQ